MSETTKLNKIVSIIPARGGSKGIPRKNLIDIAGKPLISYSIKASLNSVVNETWVSSEDNEIIDVAKRYGIKTLLRPKKLATDLASSESVLTHFIQQVDCTIIVFIQPTSPLITSEDINKGLDLLNNYDSVISVTELTQFIWEDGKPNYDIHNRKRRQDLAKTFLETGAFFITTKDRYYNSKNRISGNVGFCEVPKIRSFDIDSYDDLELVRKILE